MLKKGNRMDLSKFNIGNYNKSFVNFPKGYINELKQYEKTENINCIFYFISKK